METMGIETAIDAIETYKSLGDWRYADKEAAWKWMFEVGRKHAIAEAAQKDLWKARCLRMARALSAVMDRTHDHDIQAATGLPNCQCERIAEARADAEEIIGDEMRQGRVVTR